MLYFKVASISASVALSLLLRGEIIIPMLLNKRSDGTAGVGGGIHST